MSLEPGAILSYPFHVEEELNFCLDKADDDESRMEGPLLLPSILPKPFSMKVSDS